MVAAGSLALDRDAHVEGPLIVVGDLDVAGTPHAMGQVKAHVASLGDFDFEWGAGGRRAR